MKITLKNPKPKKTTKTAFVTNHSSQPFRFSNNDFSREKRLREIPKQQRIATQEIQEQQIIAYHSYQLDPECPNCGNTKDTRRNSSAQLLCYNCGYEEPSEKPSKCTHQNCDDEAQCFKCGEQQ